MLLGFKSVAVLRFDDHLNMRKLMNPAFNPNHLARGVPRLVDLAQEHCSQWAEQGDVMGAKAIKAFTFHVRMLPSVVGSAPRKHIINRVCFCCLVHLLLWAEQGQVLGAKATKAITIRSV